MIYLLTNVAKTQDVLLDGTIFFGNTGQKNKATFMNKNMHYYRVVLSLQKPTEIKFDNTLKQRRLEVMYMATNVAIIQDVPLDGTFFFGNAGQWDKTN